MTMLSSSGVRRSRLALLGSDRLSVVFYCCRPLIGMMVGFRAVLIAAYERSSVL